MTPEQFAAMLNGREYRSEITRDEAATAKRHGLVVVFGASDDLCELRGAIDDEVGCYDGGRFRIDAKGIVPSSEAIDPKRMSDDEIRNILDRRRDAVTIEAVWHDEDRPAWTYKAPFPHATFDIHDDGDPYCRGIVFAIAEISGTDKPKAEHERTIEWTGEATDDQLHDEARESLLKHLERTFGPRCPDVNKHCPQCRAWAAFDTLFPKD